MKTTSTILLLLIMFCMYGYGQVDLKPIPKDFYKSAYHTDLTPLRIPIDSLPEYLRSSIFGKYDTAKVIMLVCDTFHYSNYTPQFSITNYFDKAGEITWITGYKVNSSVSGIATYTVDEHGSIKDNLADSIEYLDSDKQPLKKSIIVWQTIPLK